MYNPKNLFSRYLNQFWKANSVGKYVTYLPGWWQFITMIVHRQKKFEFAWQMNTEHSLCGVQFWSCIEKSATFFNQKSDSLQKVAFSNESLFSFTCMGRVDIAYDEKRALFSHLWTSISWLRRYNLGNNFPALFVYTHYCGWQYESV